MANVISSAPNTRREASLSSAKMARMLDAMSDVETDPKMLALGSSGAGSGLIPVASSDSTELAGSDGERFGTGAAGTMAER